MKKLALTIVILLVGYFTFSQTKYFNKTYDFNNGLESGMSVHVKDGGYTITMAGDSLSHEAYGYIGIDSTGILTSYRIYPETKSFVRGGKAVITSNNTIADFRTIQKLDTNQNVISYAKLIIANTQGDTITTVKYIDSTTKNIYSSILIESSDSGFLLVSERNLNPDYDPLIIKTDEHGNELWRKYINTPKREVLKSIVYHPNGDYYLAGAGNSKGSYWSWLVRMDDSANVKWQRYYYRSSHYATVSLLRDGNLILGTDSFITNNGTDDITKKRILKIEPNKGDIIWEQTHDATMPGVAYSKTIEGGDSSLYVLGAYYYKHYPNYTLTRLNYFGDTIWQNLYYHLDKEDLNYLWDFARTNDSGFIFCGQAFSINNNQDVWVLKVDSNGCTSPACESRVYDVRVGIDYRSQLKTEFKVFPNPASEYINIQKLSNSKESWSYTFFDNLGKQKLTGEMENAEKVDVSNLPSGIYHLQLKHGPARKSFKVVVE